MGYIFDPGGARRDAHHSHAMHASITTAQPIRTDLASPPETSLIVSGDYFRFQNM